MTVEIKRHKKEQEECNTKSIFKMQNKQLGKLWAMLIQHVVSSLFVKGTKTMFYEIYLVLFLFNFQENVKIIFFSQLWQISHK